MFRIRPLLVALAALVTISLVTAPTAHAIKARDAIARAGSHCTVDVFVENGKAGVMIICGTFPDQTVIFCKGDEDCYISRAPVQTVPTTRKPGQGASGSDVQQTPAPESAPSIPTRLPKEATLAYVNRIRFAPVTTDDALVRKALQAKALAGKATKAK